MKKILKGKDHPSWKGGVKIHEFGYRLIASPDHPFKDKQGYVREHRLVMEKKLGRYLTKEELVHHINGIKTDNRIENLILTTRSEHKKIHNEIGLKTRFKKGQTSLNKSGWYSKCIECGKNIWINRSLAKHGKKFCSLDCKYKSMKGKKIGYNYL